MAMDVDGDLVVDVLIVGGGITGHYLARQLVDDYSVCLLTDPTVGVETLDTDGYLSAGYEGNDVSRIQPARRAAGYWKLWAESTGVPHHRDPAIFAVPPDQAVTTPRLWSDAALNVRPAPDLPPVFGRGSIADDVPYFVEDDVVIDPGALLARLRSFLVGRCLEGEVVKFQTGHDKGIEYVEVEMDGVVVPIVPRYTVLAASGANGGLLNKVAVRLRDPARRKDAVELSKACQAVRKHYAICLRGDSLPLVAGTFGGFRVAAHPADGSSSARIWVVSPPVDDSSTTLGPADLRFDLPVDSSVVATAVDQLLAMSPELARLAPRLEWGVYAHRQTEHPMMATPDTSNIAQPAPAKLETLGLEGFMALWPSHPSYSMIVGDVAGERIREALGPRAVELDSRPFTDFPTPAPDLRARWNRPDFPWSDWESFSETHDLKPLGA